MAYSFTLFGSFDMGVAALFYEPHRGFPAFHDPIVTMLRLSTRLSAIGFGLFVLAGLGWRVVLGRRFFGLSRAAVFYLTLVFLLGPGLPVNGVLKEHWGRARPSQITEFGGVKHYTPPLLISDQCDHNCSFVSGEASVGFAFAAFGFAAANPRMRRVGLAAGLGLGSAFGLLRMAQGGHFLSDVFFAGLFTVALAWLLERILRAHNRPDRLGLSHGDSEPC